MRANTSANKVLTAYLKRKGLKLLKRRAGEYEVVGIDQWIYVGTARMRTDRQWSAIDDGGLMRERPFPTLDVCVRFIARGCDL